MAGFLDRVSAAAKNAAAATGEIAKNAAEKGQDMVEVTKLNNRIREEQNQIAGAKKNIGEIMYNRFADGAEIDDQIREICEEIDVKTAALNDLKAEVERIKGN